ncbi:hypothetical protein DRP07_04240, partial [Archaeoglobales archaeon]
MKIVAKIWEYMLDWYYKIDSKQFIPTSDDLKDKEVKRIVNRLKGKSEKETLTNLLEWQEKNIKYWDDRADAFIVLLLLALLSISFYPIPNSTKLPLIFVFAMFLLMDLLSVVPYIISLTIWIIILFSLIYSINFSIAN